MFEQMGAFDQAYAPVSATAGHSPALPLRRRKSWKQQIVFWLVNLLLVLPTLAIVYITIVAEGLRVALPGFSTRLSRLSVPAIGVMANYDGFDRIDVAVVTSLVLCITVSYVWFRVFLELNGHGRLTQQSQGKPILAGLFAAIAVTIVGGDAALFYFGLASQASSGWSDTPAYVCIGATVLYSTGLAFLGGYHSDYHTSGEV